MTPWIALAPDISGVCSVEDTLEMTSKPTKTREHEERQQARCRRSCDSALRPLGSAVMGHAHGRDDLVGEVRGESAFDGHQQ